MQQTEMPIPIGTKVNYFNPQYKILIPCHVIGVHESSGKLMYTLKRAEPTAKGKSTYAGVKKRYIRRYKGRHGESE